MILNTIAMWKQETRNPARGRSVKAAQLAQPSFREAWKSFIDGGKATRRLLAIGLGTMAFSMQDVLLEPYGGQILRMTVGETTTLTASLALGGLVGFSLASNVLSRGFDPFRMAARGAMVGVPAFLLVILAASTQSIFVFTIGVLLVGFGAGLFGHGTLTATMNSAPKDQVGLAMGTWGAVQATSASVAVALGGILGDSIGSMATRGLFGASLQSPNTGYAFVYALEIVFLVGTVFLMSTLNRSRRDPVPA
jgi:BCD family chlorophyll transporter-like MFS transporter